MMKDKNWLILCSTFYWAGREGQKEHDYFIPKKEFIRQIRVCQAKIDGSNLPAELLILKWLGDDLLNLEYSDERFGRGREVAMYKFTDHASWLIEKYIRY